MKIYFKEFEKRVMLPLFLEDSRPVYQPVMNVPIRPGKLHPTEFGRFIGDTFVFDGILAFNYYGLFKVSDKIKQTYLDNLKIFPGIRVIQSPVVNFASILPADVQYICPDLYEGFREFKEYIVKLRWNNNEG